MDRKQLADDSFDFSIPIDDVEDYWDPPDGEILILPNNRSDGAVITEFQHACDRHHVTPVFTFNEVQQAAFTARVQVGTEIMQTDTPFPSKKLAKEAVCKRALGSLSFLHDKEPRGRSNNEAEWENHNWHAPVVDRSEDWVSILHCDASQRKAPRPEFVEFTSENNPHMFGCTLTLDDAVYPFPGFRHKLYASKKDAKAAVAQEAVQVLRAEGKLPSGPTKKGSSTSVPGSQGRERDSISELDDEADEVEPKSLSQCLHYLVASLGFIQPQFKTEKLPGNFYNAAVYFSDEDVKSERRLAGPVGQVDRIFGSKNAKNACYQRTLPLLEQILNERKNPEE